MLLLSIFSLRVILTLTMITIALVLIVLFFLSFLFLRRKSDWPDPSPPHPPLHPLLGNIKSITNNDPIFHLAFHNLAASFGNIFRMSLKPGTWSLFLAGFEEIKVVLEIKIFVRRHQPHICLQKSRNKIAASSVPVSKPKFMSLFKRT